MPKTETTNCWCLACEPNTGEIGLECRKVMRGNISAKDFVNKLFENPEIKAVYERPGKTMTKTAKLKRPMKCEECWQNYADPPAKICPGCQAYKEHQQ